MANLDYAGLLRRELAVTATQYAQEHGIPYYVSLGAPPTVLFCRHGQNRHGNFMQETYSRICSIKEWERRLHKVHSQKAALPVEHRPGARELDSSTSSDALGMNVFCHPDSQNAPLLAALFGLPTLPEPKFGVKVGVPLTNGGRDGTEVDLLLGPVHVEFKLTEHDFTRVDLARLQTYADAEAVFDFGPLTDKRGKLMHYQLLRNVLAVSRDPERRFVLLHDQRRPDLRAAFDAVREAIRQDSVKARVSAITWQEVAFCAPPAVTQFLRVKYGIEPRPAPGIGRGVFTSNLALRTLYEYHVSDLFDELQGSSGVSNPHLIEVPEEYEQARLRLMVVGQQTFGYEGTIGEGVGEQPVDKLMAVYRNFRLAEHYVASPFWEAARKLHGLLNPGGSPFGFVWSNLIKVDQHGRRPDPEVEVASRQAFPVLAGEVAILSPNVLIFFTGPNYDGALRSTFAGLELRPCAGHEVGDLARVEHPSLPRHTYRTHHPKTLRLRKIWWVLEAVAQLSDI